MIPGIPDGAPVRWSAGLQETNLSGLQEILPYCRTAGMTDCRKSVLIDGLQECLIAGGRAVRQDCRITFW